MEILEASLLDSGFELIVRELAMIYYVSPRDSTKLVRSPDCIDRIIESHYCFLLSYFTE